MVVTAMALQILGGNNKIPAAEKMIMAGRILNTRASSFLDSAVRRFLLAKKFPDCDCIPFQIVLFLDCLQNTILLQLQP